MKKLFISFSILFFLLLIAFISFYIFASGPSLDENMYNQVIRYDVETMNIPDTFSVMTYNVGYLSGMTNNRSMDRGEQLFEDNLAEAVGLLKEIRPTIIGMQEVDFGSARSYYYNQSAEVASKVGYPYIYQSINWDKRYVPFPYWPIKFHFGEILSGQAILSRFPITIDSTITLIKPVNSSFLYNSLYLDRLIQVGDVQIGDKTIKVMNLHLEAFDEETRVLQAQVVKRLFEAYAEEMPVLLIGDFNSRPVVENQNSRAMKVVMEAKYIASAIPDSIYAGSPESYYTFSSGAPYQMIDYILYNENYIQSLDGRVVKEAQEISDHLPVLMNFVLKSEIAQN